MENRDMSEFVLVPLAENFDELVSVFIASAASIQFDVQNLRDVVDELNIACGHWEAVSPKRFDHLTLEERWEYQKWVWGAPKRWMNNLRERLWG